MPTLSMLSMLPLIIDFTRHDFRADTPRHAIIFHTPFFHFAFSRHADAPMSPCTLFIYALRCLRVFLLVAARH